MSDVNFELAGPDFTFAGDRRRISGLFATWYRRHVTRKSLRRLDPARLADLGLSEADVRRELKKWFWQ